MSWLFSDTDEGPRSTRWSFVTGLIVGALALATLWVAVAITAGSNSERDGSELPTVLGTETADADPSTGEPASVADVCAQVYRAQTPVLRAADPSVAGWAVHVDTMNQLVAGDITPAQVTDFWERTRREATALLEEYDKAAATYDARTIRCPTTLPSTQEGPTNQNARCQSAATAREAVLSRARRALATWQEHMHHMERWRAGTLGPARVVRLWQLNWRASLEELRAYDRAQRAAAGQTC